uniref:ER lumen protein-retaining receptor C28H8.4 n=1 Tax=Diabrotica virgifera virgifera TaxID=50390 RepID=A0A6P7F849_DIAVI
MYLVPFKSSMFSKFEEIDFFRIIGNSLHISAIVYLICSIIKEKSYAGISAKTQFLYAAVFITRYLDSFWVVRSPYNTVVHVTIVFFSVYTFLLAFRMKRTYERKYEFFWSEVFVGGALILALFVNNSLEAIEVLRTFSQYLEAVAMIPQMYMIFQSRKITQIMKSYLFLMVVYKLLYICNGIYLYNRYHQFDPIPEIASFVNVMVLFIALVIWRCSKIQKYEKKDVTKWRNIFIISDSFTNPGTTTKEAPLITEKTDQPVVLKDDIKY